MDLLAQTLTAAGVDLPSINPNAAVPDTSDKNMLSFYQAGLLTGTDRYGTFRGNESLNRGQAAAILARLIDPAQRVTFTPTSL